MYSTIAASQLATLVPAGLFWTDAAGRIVGCNTRFATLVGAASPQAVVGRDWAELLPMEPQDDAFDDALEAADGSRVTRIAAPGGDGELWLKYQLMPASDPAVPEVSFAGAVSDVTQEHLALQAVERSELQLKAAVRAADEANRAKSEFLATMSHEIRTPINGVIGLAHLLANRELPAQERDYVDGIASCARSLLSLVDNILDLSKIEARHLTLELLPLDLPAFLDEIASMFTARAAEKGLAFGLQVDPAAPSHLLTDPTRFRQILVNLLGNAIKFTPAGRVQLHVATRIVKGVETLELAVSDTGIGIGAEARERIFRHYTQADTSTTRKYSGTGLGLAISQQLARLMGGDVDVASELGAGSTFTLRLPLVRAPGVRKPAAPPAGVAHASGLAVLLVEDNEINRMVCRGLLAMLGIENVTVACDGVEALAIAARARFDLVLMDCQMPNMDGFECTRQLRARGVATPIFALTANAMSGDKARCLEAGMNDYMPKPVDPKVLAHKIASLRPHATPAPMAAAPLPDTAERDFDEAIVDIGFMGDAAFYAEVRDAFVADAPGTVERIAALLRAGDLAACQRVAHGLKGAAGTVGAPRLASLCECLEKAERLGAVNGWADAARRSLAGFRSASAGQPMALAA